MNDTKGVLQECGICLMLGSMRLPQNHNSLALWPHMTNKVYPALFRGRWLRIGGRHVRIWAYINKFFRFLTSAFLTCIREITPTYRQILGF